MIPWCVKIRSRNTRIKFWKNSYLFWSWKIFNADKYFAENLAPWRNPLSSTKHHIAISQCTYGRKVGEAIQNQMQK